MDFLTKPVQREALFEALQRALARDAAERAARAQAEQLRAAFAALPPREQAVFDRVVAGQLNKRIADALGIAERTVKMQRARPMAKLGASSAGWPSGCNTCPIDPVRVRDQAHLCPFGQTPSPLRPMVSLPSPSYNRAIAVPVR